MSREIPLTQGKVTLVDDDMFACLNQHKWYAKRDGNAWYASRKIGKWPNRRSERMHRVIMNAPDGMECDHRNHDGLDNRKANLRLCTHSQNQQNRRTLKGRRYKGVYCRAKRNCWQAHIKHNGIRIHLGYHESEVAAARAYDTAAKQLFGEYACPNFPEKAVAVS